MAAWAREQQQQVDAASLRERELTAQHEQSAAEHLRLLSTAERHAADAEERATQAEAAAAAMTRALSEGSGAAHEQLAEEVRRLEMNLEAARTEADAAKATATAATAAVAAAEAATHSAEVEAEAARAERRHAVEESAAARALAMTAEADAEAARVEAQAARAESATLRVKSGAAEAEAEAARAQAEGVKAAVQESRAEAEAATAEAEALRAEVAGARASAGVAEAEAEAARVEARATMAEATTAAIEADAAKAEAQALRAELDVRRAEAAASGVAAGAPVESDAWAQERAELLRKLAGATDALHAAQAAQHEADGSREAAWAEARAKQDALEASESRLAASSARVEELVARLGREHGAAPLTPSAVADEAAASTEEEAASLSGARGSVDDGGGAGYETLLEAAREARLAAEVERDRQCEARHTAEAERDAASAARDQLIDEQKMLLAESDRTARALAASEHEATTRLHEVQELREQLEQTALAPTPPSGAAKALRVAEDDDLARELADEIAALKLSHAKQLKQMQSELRKALAAAASPAGRGRGSMREADTAVHVMHARELEGLQAEVRTLRAALEQQREGPAASTPALPPSARRERSGQPHSPGDDADDPSRSGGVHGGAGNDDAPEATWEATVLCSLAELRHSLLHTCRALAEDADALDGTQAQGKELRLSARGNPLSSVNDALHRLARDDATDASDELERLQQTVEVLRSVQERLTRTHWGGTAQPPRWLLATWRRVAGCAGVHATGRRADAAPPSLHSPIAPQGRRGGGAMAMRAEEVASRVRAALLQTRGSGYNRVPLAGE